MSLIRQTWTLLLGVIFTALVGSVLVSILTARGYLEAQLQTKNQDEAQLLALSLNRLDTATERQLALQAMFDLGYFQAIRWKGVNGEPLVTLVAASGEMGAPAWFVALVPLVSPPGTAYLDRGWERLGSVEVISQTRYAHEALWAGTRWTGLALGLTGALAVLLGHLGVRRLRRPLDRMAEQARALTERRFVTQPLPRTAELRPAVEAMNVLVDRVRTMLAEQARQVDELRQLADGDPLTGVSHRRHFMSRFEALLTEEDAWSEGQLGLVRVLGLAELNRRLGHGRTDELLRALAQALLHDDPSGDDSPGPVVGRLNGSDFALLARRPADAERIERRLQELLTLAGADAGLQLAVSATNWRHGEGMATVLARADAALARAEVSGRAELAAEAGPLSGALRGGEDNWRRQFLAALQPGRARLVSFPVIGPDHKRLHHECPLRLQLDTDGSFQPAAQWLPFALRTHMIASIDELALSLALEAIAQDGEERGINLAPASLADAAFVARLRTRLVVAPAAAQRLWVEVDEVALRTDLGAVVALAAHLRPLGVRVGVEHAGHGVTSSEGLLEAGLDFVKLDASVVRDVASDLARQSLVRSTTALLRGLGLAVYAEGVQSQADLDALWRCGLDGATGPAVQPMTR